MNSFTRTSEGFSKNCFDGAVSTTFPPSINMTLLDKVIFIADFISADRDYDGVDKMRKLADKNLEEACLEGMAFTISDYRTKISYSRQGRPVMTLSSWESVTPIR